jgi:O-antigen/teichoic acid export membrane protein
MAKAIEMGEVSARGGFHLFLGVALSSVISSLGTIILVRLLTPDQYGLYAIALIPPTLIGLFRDWGINFSMIKYLAQYKSASKTADMKRVLASGLLSESLLGAFLSIICFLLTSFLAINVFDRPELQQSIGIASLLILGSGLFTAAQSAFVGFERMELASLTMVIQSIFKSSIGPLLAFLGYGTLGAVLGHTASFLIAGILGISITYFIFHKNLHGEKDDKSNLTATFKTMFRYGFPLSITIILTGFLLQFFSFMIAIYCTDFMVGNYQAAVKFAVIITFFTMPIGTVLFPVFSKLNPEKEMETLRTVFQSSVKYASLLTIPATVAIMVLSKPLVFTLFTEEYTSTPLFLTLYAITYLYTALGNLSIGNFLNGQGKTTVTMNLIIIQLATGIPLSFLLIPRFGVTGLIAATLVSSIPSIATGLWWIRKHFGATVDWESSARILAAAAIAAIITYLILFILPTPDWINMIVGGIIFFGTYLIAAPLIGALNTDDITNLKQMLTGLGPLSQVFDVPLDLIEKLTKTFQKT